jgi:DNA-directed RNA polymerase subunit L
MFSDYNYDKKADKHSFTITNIDLGIVNAIRRIILSEIPMIGFYGEDKDEEPTVEIIINNSPLHNEFMIHRIGLIPLHISEEITEIYEDNDYEFELNVENKSSDTINVTTGNITGKYKDKNLTKAELDKIFPTNKTTNSKILITRLRGGEHIHFTAKAIKRTGKLNASFSPVSLSNFYYVQNKTEADKKDNILDKERSFLKNEYGDPSTLNFQIESVNGFSYKYLFQKALDIINEKLQNLIIKLSAKEIEIIKVQNCDNSYEFKIMNEDDTLGNLIQSLVHNRYIRSKDEKRCHYVGYICPHPLISELLIRFTLNDENTQNFYDFFIDNCKDIIKIIDEIKAEWNSFAS